MANYMKRAIAKLEADRVTNQDLRKSLILEPTPRQWWEKEHIEYAFAHPYVRNRLERLMGSNIVRITDRRYMKRLQERIYEEHQRVLWKKLDNREWEEINREKRLILRRMVPMEEAHPDLKANHPVLLMHNIADEIYRNSPWAQIRKTHRGSVFDQLFGEEVVDAETTIMSGLTPSKMKPRVSGRGMFHEKGRGEKGGGGDRKDDEDMKEGDIDKRYMFSQEEYEWLKYETPAIRRHKKAENVDEIFSLADGIICDLRTMKTNVKIPPKTKEIHTEED